MTKIDEIMKLQEEIDNRTQIELVAVELICQCKFEEAMEILAALD